MIHVLPALGHPCHLERVLFLLLPKFFRPLSQDLLPLPGITVLLPSLSHSLLVWSVLSHQSVIALVMVGPLCLKGSFQNSDGSIHPMFGKGVSLCLQTICGDGSLNHHLLLSVIKNSFMKQA